MPDPAVNRKAAPRADRVAEQRRRFNPVAFEALAGPSSAPMRPLWPCPARSLGRSLGRLQWLTILLVVLVGPAVGAAERDESSHWAPSFALFFDVIGQKASGTAKSGSVLGPPLEPYDQEQDAFAAGNGCLRATGTFPGPYVYDRDGTLCESGRETQLRTLGLPANKLLPDDAGHDTSIAPLVGGSLELMTPSLLGEHLLRPRLFAHADVAAAFAYERNLAGVEGPGEFALPKGLVIPRGFDPHDALVDEIAIQGQGSRTRMQVERWIYSGGIGLALTTEFLDRRIRIKPSFEYLREEIEYLAVVRRAVQLRRPPGAVDLSGFRLVSLNDTDRETYDGIGPGLELEVDAARLGPFVSSVFVLGRGYYLYGDFDIKMSATNEFGETATWTADLERWAWRGGVGIRFRWEPEAD
jgi:hypothetical protein